MIVTKAEPKGPPEKGNGLIYFDGELDGVWTPKLADVLPYVGKELPPGWVVKDHPTYVNRDGSPSRQAFPPREPKGGGKGGFTAAWTNTEEGAKYRLQIEQEGLDRRTAIMQAVILFGKEDLGEVELTADRLYGWLRKTATGRPAPEPRGPVKASKPPAPASPPPAPAEAFNEDVSRLSDFFGDAGDDDDKPIVSTDEYDDAALIDAMNTAHRMLGKDWDVRCNIALKKFGVVRARDIHPKDRRAFLELLK